jgi:hypothetical protein
MSPAASSHVGSAANDEPDVPAGWVQFGVDENGQPVYGYVGPRNPQWRL